MGFSEEIRKRILVLDGAMGTMLQQGLTEEQTLQAYIDAGADIITTNSFNANSITHGSGARAEALEAARRARRIADAARREASAQQGPFAPREIFVAGSVSLTGKSLSLPSDASDPAFRSVSFDELKDSFREQIGALAEGGADLILLETCFDALNAKAAICALEELGAPLPVIISATVSDRSGRTLTGQTLEAFYTSVRHCPRLEAFGINCALGASAMVSLVREIAGFSDLPLIFYPNAGIPDEFGRYNDSPAAIARVMQPLVSEGLVQIIGGCCGTTPAHIRALAELDLVTPRLRRGVTKSSCTVSGLEAVRIENFTNVGERTNVAGSKKFARLIAERKFNEALEVAAAQIEGGADIIDVNMDDPMLDSAEAMRTFLRHASGDPAVAKAAVMIDSSHWETILEGLKNTQGKCIVNSLSLKEGEREFIRKARIVRSFGAALVVMAFDEEGQAVSFQRKIDICARSYRLLTQEAGFPPEDIIFDCNILSIGTGIPEHARFGVDFIEAVRWIKANLPGAKTSGGVSNLSFAFRGNNAVREAMHSAFLYHAIKAGLDMAIVNPSMLRVYDDIDESLRRCVEDVIFDSDPDATSRLVEKAAELSAAGASNQGGAGASGPSLASGRGGAFGRGGAADLEPLERLPQLLVKGSSDGLKECTLACLERLGSAVEVISGPLMAGMAKVGELFADGRMFLPQVVKSAATMREAVAVLQPYMAASEAAGERPRFLIATVQGDVHDIGKNITSIVLQCSGLEVNDLGVMVPSSEIISGAERTQADIIGLSGLITPSLQRMEEVCRVMAERGMTTPLFVGGAAASPIHTAVKLAPLYRFVAYCSDASDTAVKAKRCLADPSAFWDDEHRKQSTLRQLREAAAGSAGVGADGGASGATGSVPAAGPSACAGPGFLPGEPFRDVPIQDIPASELLPYMDWRMFATVLGIKPTARNTSENAGNAAGSCNSASSCTEAGLPAAQAEAMAWIKKNSPTVRLTARFYPCRRSSDTLVCSSPTSSDSVIGSQDNCATTGGAGFKLPMLRDSSSGACLADYFPADRDVQLGLFAVSVPQSAAQGSLLPGEASSAQGPQGTLKQEEVPWSPCAGTPATGTPDLMEHATRVTLAEAGSAYLREKFSTVLPQGMKLIMPGIGYACCPDHSLKRDVLAVLDNGSPAMGITLTDSCAMIPEASICGLIIAHRDASYRDIKTVSPKDLKAYSEARGFSPEEEALFLGHLK